jgi:hypothetical protein
MIGGEAVNDIWKYRPEDLSETELIAWALTEVATAINQHWHWMGTTDASTPMGATEVLGEAIKEGCQMLASSIEQAAMQD